MGNSRVRCSHCRFYILREDVFLDAGIGRFCSSECVSEHQTAKRNKKRDKLRQAKRRSSPVKKSRHIPTDVRATVHRRDGCCRWCSGKGSQLHHVKYRSEGGPDVEENLIFLCNGCHGRAHSSKEAFQPLLELYLWVAYTEARFLTIPQIAGQLRAAGLLSELQEERLYGTGSSSEFASTG